MITEPDAFSLQENDMTHIGLVEREMTDAELARMNAGFVPIILTNA